MLLGAARYLAETRNFDGTVYLIFQPAEETVGGADMMIKEGLFDRFPMERVFGMHNWPALPAGTFAWREGPVMAAVGNVTIDITGRGGHGAQPHLTVDPILVSAHIITGLQTIVSRSVDPAESAVVTIGQISAGNANNVIPETVHMEGTARWFAPAIGDKLEMGVHRIASGIAASLGAQAEVRFVRSYPATVNNAVATQLAVCAACAVAGESRVRPMQHPSMGSEDFAYMLNARPGCYILLGGGRGSDDAMVHHPRYDFNDDILTVGASYWATLVEQLLARRGESTHASSNGSLRVNDR
jgi:hippurate hydrolase